jgi:hypothetical protein
MVAGIQTEFKEKFLDAVSCLYCHDARMYYYILDTSEERGFERMI